ncbi:acyl--CoA ligase [Frankia sp. CNm7]|uniref:Acyl--CoA ligase n=1 Tax=Frankia nepalensis TaxID=1836974 RepID=A0A937RQT3_9ACTN|nr:class I adenylate-forming enzyme family protein [Frankia nepalensis]MBL7498701.1 acyl--CoA ligase [Frankia nepalensis]MBL7512923.1 acyl--CoA ligase [Frankia nepalensis]MBL7521657.1 acyl--CoA ligase [Frankia nepalensis]MBL7633214.1 acyl--CoA ligase [Frankia nepalensis]
METKALPAEASPAADLREVRAALTRPGAMFEIQRADVRGNEMPVFTRRLRSLRQLLEASARFGDRTYLVDGEVRLSFAEHRGRVDALAHALQTEFRVAAGDRVALFAANRWDWLVGFWAAASVGAIPCAMNGWWTPAEYRHAADLVEPVLVIGDRQRLERVARAGTTVAVLSLDDDLPRLLREHAGKSPAPVPVAEDDPALLLFTSGTTGRPKAVSIPHRSFIGFAQVNTFAEVATRAAYGMPVPDRAEDLAPSDDVVLVTAPLFHVSMLQGAALTAAVKGSSIVLLPGRFDPERVLRTIENERVTGWSALGSAAQRVATCDALGRYDTSSVQYLGLGGAPASPTVQELLRKAFPTASNTLGMGYSSTEAGAVIASINGAEYLAHPTSTGRIMATIEVELRDETGTAVADGEYGEVHVRSPYTMLGYWNDPRASSEVLKEGGWLALGDVARFEDGLLYINARARDLILVSAENVSPTEVEYVLEASDQVDEAAVLAVDDEVTGDAVCAVVVPRPGASPTPERLAEWCRARLAHYKVPTRWYVIDGPLLRTPTGKLVKRDLRAWIDAGADTAGPPPAGA